jgi:ribosomal protein S18
VKNVHRHGGCCSQDCIDVIHSEVKKNIRRELKTAIRFSKRKIRCIDFKIIESLGTFVLQEPKVAIKKRTENQKQYVGKGTHFTQNQVLVNF